MVDEVKTDVSKAVTDIKTSATSEVLTLRARVAAAEAKTEEAWKAHKWFFLAGIVAGIVIGAFLATHL